MSEENTTNQETYGQGAAEEQAGGREESGAPEPAPRENPPEGTTGAEDLFDLMGDAGKAFKKPAAASASGQKKAGEQAGAKPVKYRAGIEIHHAGHKLSLPKEMTEQEIYEFLADDFPEVTADRAEIRHDRQKDRLVIAFKSFKKGSSRKAPRTLEVLADPPALEPGESYPPVFRLLGEDGVYEVRKSGAGTFIAKVPSDRKVLEGFYPAVPKAPASLLSKAVRIFKERPDREAVVNVVYDRREGKHHLVWNEQRGASAGSVTYDPLPETDGLVPYVEIHSHNAMPAFFSETDDFSEVRTGLYGVIGRVDKKRPEAAFRLSCGGIFVPLWAGKVFHNPSGVNVVGAIVRDLFVEGPYRRGAARSEAAGSGR